MLESLWSWLGEKTRPERKAQSEGLPTFEPLEPRLLLSADSLCTQPLISLELPRQDQAIVIDLHQQVEQSEATQPALFTFELSPSAAAGRPLQDGVANADAAASVPTSSDEAPTVNEIGPVADSSLIETGSAATSSSSESLLGSPEHNVETAQSVSTTSTQTEPAGPHVADQQPDSTPSSESQPIEIRGPPAGQPDSSSDLSYSSYSIPSDSCETLQVEGLPAPSGSAAPDLPGLRLVDPDISNWQGQIIYLDFDGAQNVTYHGPVTVGPFDVPAFSFEGTPLEGQEQATVSEIVSQLQRTFAGSGVILTTEQPEEGTPYSTIYIGGDGSAFRQYGSFLGLAEQVDIGNQDRRDKGFVFGETVLPSTSDMPIYAGTLANLVAHEAGHLLGYVHVGQEAYGDLTHVAATLTATVKGAAASSWDSSHDDFRESTSYDGGIQLGGRDWGGLNDLSSKPTYTFALPRPAMAPGVELTNIEVAISGKGAWGFSEPQVIIGGVAQQKRLLEEETENPYTVPISRLRPGDGLIDYLDVTIDATSGYYDLRDISIKYTYSGIGDDELSRIAYVITGRTTLESFVESHDYFWDSQRVIGTELGKAIQKVIAKEIISSGISGIGGLWGEALEAIADLTGASAWVEEQLANMWDFFDSDASQIWDRSIIITNNKSYADGVRGSIDTAIGSLNRLLDTYYDALGHGSLLGDALPVNEGIAGVVSSLQNVSSDMRSLVSEILTQDLLQVSAEVREETARRYAALAKPLLFIDFLANGSDVPNAWTSEERKEASYLYQFADKLSKQVLPTFTVTAGSDSNGQIDPSGQITVHEGERIGFKATPNAGYRVNQWLLDGQEITERRGYSDYRLTVTGPHTVHVTFVSDDFGEPNNTWQQASDLGLIEGERAWQSLHISSGDVDYYRFSLSDTGTDRDLVSITIPGGGKGTNDLDISLGKVRNGVLRPATGKWGDVSSSWNNKDIYPYDDRHDGLSLKGFGPGEYYIIVYGSSGLSGDEALSGTDVSFVGTESGDYSLDINGPMTDAYEPDDAAESASLIRTDGILQHHSLPGSRVNEIESDVDWVRFQVNQLSEVVITTDVVLGDLTTNDLGLRISLYGPDTPSSLITTDYDGNGDARISRSGASSLPPGLYYVKTTSDTTNDIRHYTIGVTVTPLALPDQSISGYVRTPDGLGLDAVTIWADGLVTATTDSNGYYSTDVPYGWSGQVTVERARYDFVPAYRGYSSVTSNQTNQDYTGTFIYAGGSGTSDDPFQIATAESFRWFSSMSSEWDKHFILVADLDFQGASLTPVGSNYWPFAGVFDGNNHVICNAIISKSDGYFVGLFSGLDLGSEIRNLDVEDVTVGGYTYLGGLAGSSGGTISNCHATGSVNASDLPYIGGVGGLVGSNSGTISNCYASVVVNGDRIVGGLAGLNYGIITDSYATGDVTGSSGIGALVGANGWMHFTGTISACYATGTARGSSGEIGGLVGDNFGAITDSYAMGNADGGWYVGGLVGYNYGAIASSCARGVARGDAAVGALAGANGAIEYTGTISACYATGAADADQSVGGLVGLNNYGAISSSYATGAVSGNYFVGGLVGQGYYEVSGGVSSSFWDIQTSGQSASVGGTGKTTAEMKQQATFTDAGWDFVAAWQMPVRDYPRLVWQPVSAPGDLDPTFGTGGKVTTPIGSSNDYGFSVALQPDGKIVVAGFSSNGSNFFDFALVRYDANGSLDSAFGTGGKVTTPLGSSSDIGFSVALQPDGKIVVAGYSFNGSNNDFALVRYNANGSLDGTFGTGGKVTTDFGSSGDYGYSVALQPDGQIVVAGYSFNGSNNDFALVRYNANGSLDSTFGTGGKVTTPLGSSSDIGYSVALQPDGKIVVAGHGYNAGNDDFALVRYNANGSLDSTFGAGGNVTTHFGSSSVGLSVALQPDGKIVVAGSIYNGSSDFALVRYNANGSLDSTFGTGGKVTTDFGSHDDYGYSVALQPDGQIVVAGHSYNAANYDFALVRYDANGSLDSTFGTGGKVTTPLGSYDDRAQSVALQPNGQIVVAGYSFNGSNSDFALVRYVGYPDTVPPDPPVITSFANDTGTSGDGITSDSTLVVRGAAEADSLVEIFLGSTSLGTTTVDSAGAWSFDYTATSLADGTYSFTATATDAAGNTSPRSADFAVTVDTRPAVVVTVSPLILAEDGTTNLVYTFTRSVAGSSPLTVNFSVAGTATYGTDYTQSGAGSFTATSGTVTIAANQTTAMVTMDPTADTTVEADETVLLTVVSGTGYTVGTPAATGTVQNDDATVSVAVAPGSVAEDGSPNLVYTFARNPSSNSALTVNFSVGGTATYNTDYTATGAASFTGSSGTVTIAANQTMATVTIDPTVDTTVEADETVILTVVSGTGYTVGTLAATGTILNDDIALAIVAADATKAEGHAGSTLFTFTVTRTGLTTGSTTVNYAVTGSGSNPAVAADFAGGVWPGSSVTFAANETSKTITINISGDTTPEPDEGFTVTLSGAPSGVQITTPTAPGTIQNDDTTVSVAVAPESVAEDGSPNLVYTFARNPSSNSALTVNFSVGGTATYNTDYTATGAASFTGTSGTVTILANQTTATVTIDPTVDTTVEVDETVLLTVAPGTGYTVGTPAMGTGTILNDEYPEVAVLGYGVSITNGDTTPGATDGTDFGSVAQGGTALSRTFTVRNDGTSTLTLGAVTVPTGYTLTEGLSGSLAAGASDTFTVRLDTTVAGTKAGEITFTTNDGDENPFHFAITGVVIVEDPGLLRQWATSVLGRSSECLPSPGSWSSSKALGAPDVTIYRDDVNSWAPKVNSGSAEWIALGYTTPVIAQGVTIRENNGNGAVTKIELRDRATGLWQTVWSGVDPTAAGALADFDMAFAPTSYLADGVRITLDMNHSTAWEEIDAVELKGIVPSAAPEITVQGNSTSITTGDTTPSTADWTDFGSVAQGGTALSRTFTVRNDGTSTLTLGAVSVPTGYTVTEALVGSLAAGASDTFTVRLEAETTGTKAGEISFSTNDSDENPFHFAITGVVVVEDPGLLRQWATSVLGRSSECSTGPWAAAQALGAPNVLVYRDDVNSWAPKVNSGTAEWIALGYTTPVLAQGVTIRENNGNGAVTKIELRDQATGLWQTVWSGVDPTAAGALADFDMAFAPTSYLADGVRITLDMNHSTAWEEIDAVELKGIVPSAAPEITVQGNSTSITTGDTTPSTADWTDFGSVAQGGTTLSRTFTVRNDGTAPLTLGAVTVPTGYTLTEGLSSSLAAGASDTFTVRLDATVAGTKAGEISFSTNDSDENPFHFAITGIVVVEDPGLLRQWATSVLGRSSECSTGVWSAAQALGAPNVLVYRDDVNAWAPKVNSGTAEWIALGYTTPVVAQGVTIRENNGNGAVTKIELRDQATGIWQTVWSGVDPTAPGALADFDVAFAPTSYLADGVRITLDMNHSTAWEEIDAVQLKGVVPAAAPEITVQGNSTSITTGDTTPSTADWTDFGSVAQGGTALSRTFTVRNDGTSTLTLGAVSVPTGYTVTEALVGSLAAGASDTFTVRLDAATAGTKAGEITFSTNDADENPFHFAITGVVVVEDPGLLRQWATSVLGRSSECSTGVWSAAQALGAPDVLIYRDDVNAWAPKVNSGTAEWIALGYTTPVLAQGVTIRENNGNGAVTKIELRDQATGIWQTVWSGVDPTVAGALADFDVAFAPTSYLADGVRITLDMNHSTAWEEIDAVQLKGVVPAAAPEITVLGNGVSITDGDTTPGVGDGTNFGAVAQAGTTLSRTFTVRNDATAPLTLGAVTVPTGYTLTEGLSSSLAPGASDTFTVRLEATAAGTKAGDISFTTNDSDENPFHFRITGVVDEPGIVRQWATSVLGRSSECSTGPWAATQALGAPNVLVYRDDVNAWAPKVNSGTAEWIALGYTTPVLAQGVTIRENNGNGAVTKIELRDQATGIWQTVWSGVDPTAAGALADFEVAFAPTSYLADGVRITLDMNHSTAWEEIDAVLLKGTVLTT